MGRVSRRTFCKAGATSLMALNGNFMPNRMLAVSEESESNDRRPLLSPPYATQPEEPVFLLEGSTLEDLWAVRRRVNPLLKSARNPLIVKDREWEGFGPSLAGSVVYAPEDRLFKMWYTVFHDFAFRHHLPGSYIACYAISEDGYTWHKPDLGVFEWKGSKKNNFIDLSKDVAGFAVVRPPASTAISHRYMAVYLSERPEGICLAYSDDGVRWVEHKRNPIEPSESDTHNTIVYNSSARKWMVYLRPPVYAGHWKRRIALMESSDLQTWTRAETVLIPDEADPPEFYGMPVFKRGNLYFGLLQIFNRPPGTINIELVFSSDGRRWDRVPPRELFLERGAPGQFDEGMVFTASAPVIVHGDMRIYYSGNNGYHYQLNAGQNAIGVASVPHDRFFSVTCTSHDAPGFILTRPLLLNGPSLFLNSGTLPVEGQIKVAVLDVAGKEIPGFGFDDCIPVKGDDLENEVVWKGGKRIVALPKQPLRLKFQLEKATFYAFYVK